MNSSIYNNTRQRKFLNRRSNNRDFYIYIYIYIYKREKSQFLTRSGPLLDFISTKGPKRETERERERETSPLTNVFDPSVFPLQLPSFVITNEEGSLSRMICWKP